MLFVCNITGFGVNFIIVSRPRPKFCATKSFRKVGCRAQKLGLGHTPVYEIDPWWLKITRVAHNNNTLMALDSVEVIAIKKK